MSIKHERLRAAIAGDLADRPPVALWRHFPVDDQDPQALATSIVEFQNRYDFDFVKVTPSSSYCLKDWGVEDEWHADPEGTRRYTQRVVFSPEDWERLTPLDPRDGYLGEQLWTLERIREQLGDEVPVIQTIFSPLAQAKNLAGQARLLEHLHRSPKQVRAGLETIARSTEAFIAALGSDVVDGIFYAIQHASYRYFDEATYESLSERYDQRLLEAASGFWLNVLHLHGEGLIFSLAERLPVQVVNWHDRIAGPALQDAAPRLHGAVCGGLRQEESLVLGDPDLVGTEAGEALRSLDGRGMVLGAGCVTPITAPGANLRAARMAVEDFA